MIFQGLCAYNSLLYTAFKGPPGDDNIYYAHWDGVGWSNQKTLLANAKTGKTSHGPSLAVYDGKLYAAWKGASDDAIWVSYFDGASWHDQRQIPGVGSDFGPSLAAFDGRLYAMWKGSGGDTRLFYSYMTSTAPWISQCHIPTVAAYYGPSLATVDNAFTGAPSLLYFAWGGATTDHNWYMAMDNSPTSINPSPNPTQQTMPGGSDIGPSIAAYNNHIYAAWKDQNGAEDLYFARLDFQNSNFTSTPLWGSQAQIPGALSAIGPVLAPWGPNLYAMWVGPTGDNKLYFGSFTEGGAWTMLGSTGFQTGFDG